MIKCAYRKEKKSTETYPLMDALAVAVAVDRHQGFIKSGQRYYDEATGVTVHDNRQAALTTLRSMHGVQNYSEDKLHEVTDADREFAMTIFNHFSEILVMDSLTGTLVKSGGPNGVSNDFNALLNEMFLLGKVDANKDLAMIVSLPNSYRISQKRNAMEDFYNFNKENGYIAALKSRVSVTGKVMDTKSIPRHNITLVTVFTETKQIAKFFLNDVSKLPTRDGTVTFTGTVKKQDVNTYTGCQETMFNRVKFN